jgi:bifunctional UDP-N-acetylglucosamine pyrophosphorylase/glucosamine-1-phosphate N-acetyltransferase
METTETPGTRVPGATAVILAAGLGTRMASALPKAAHAIAGRPMLLHLLAACEAVFERIVVVIGPDMPDLARLAAPHEVVVQQHRLGTGHAALQAEAHFGTGEIAILFADNPLIQPDTLRQLICARQHAGAGLSLMAMRPADPARYGRLVVENTRVTRIVEWADATPCNAGALCGPADAVLGWLRRIGSDNEKAEYYLTDLVGLAVRDGAAVTYVEAPEDELRGINSRAELAQAEAVVQGRLRQRALAGGATLMAPDTVFFSHDTSLAPDTVVGPHVVFGPGAVIGPYARLRPGTVIGEGAHVGNFVELKAASLGAGAKANHLAYLGDAEIGPGTNIGAGTITCNYDGFEKHRTGIGGNVFVGSNAVLVAPVQLGEGCFVAAGSVITEDVAPDSLVFGRARQTERPGGAAKLRARRAKEKA